MEQSGSGRISSRLYQGAKAVAAVLSALEQVLTPVAARISINCSATVSWLSFFEKQD
jgi:hypothetical protein